MHLVIIIESLRELLFSRKVESNFIKQKIHDLEDIGILIDYDNNSVNKNLVRVCNTLTNISTSKDFEL